MPGDEHLSTWLSGVSIWFTWSPVGEGWNRVIKPVECFGVSFLLPLQSEPDLLRVRCMFSRNIQDKIVFFKAVYLYQICMKTVTVFLSLGLGLHGTGHMVTGVFKLGPFTLAGIWKWVGIVHNMSTPILLSIRPISNIKLCTANNFAETLTLVRESRNALTLMKYLINSFIMLINSIIKTNKNDHLKKAVKKKQSWILINIAEKSWIIKVHVHTEERNHGYPKTNNSVNPEKSHWFSFSLNNPFSSALWGNMYKVRRNIIHVTCHVQSQAWHYARDISCTKSGMT